MMHGEPEVSMRPRLTWVAMHFGLFVFGAWLTIGAGIGVFGFEPGDFGRRLTLALFGAVLWVRMTLMAVRLLGRRFGWQEAIGVTAAVAIYQVGFAGMGAGESAALGLLDVLGISMFVLGSALNTGAEIQRWRFKQDPTHAGQLFTGGLFGVVRHPNYLGDVVWVTGWALLTRTTVALLVPLVLAASFATYFIPSLSAHLRKRYPEQYPNWASQTRRLIPWLY